MLADKVFNSIHDVNKLSSDTAKIRRDAIHYRLKKGTFDPIAFGKQLREIKRKQNGLN